MYVYVTLLNINVDFKPLCIAKVSRTEVLRVGSTSGATVANVSNIDVFEVGANIVLLS